MYTFQIYKQRNGEWRWRLIEKRSKKIVAESGESYKRKATMLKTFENLTTGMAFGRWVEEDLTE